MDNYDYNNYLPKKEDEEEVTINNKKDDMQFNPEFVKNQFQIQSLCSTHMIDRSYLSKCNWTPNQFKMKTGSNFMKPRVLESIKRNINIINDYLCIPTINRSPKSIDCYVNLLLDISFLSLIS